MWLLQFPLTFHQTKNGMLRFIAYFMTILVLIRMVFVIIWEMLWEDIFKLSTSAAAIELCEWVQVWVDVYIHHRKYQVKPHSSPWFLGDCTATIFIEITFFVCTNRISLLNLKFRQALIVLKGFLKLSNLHMLIKEKCLSLSRNLALGIFRELLIGFSTKVNLLPRGVK